ncbi:MAG TPA: hypothetical protein VMS81_02165 [Methanomicrobiales archaeon]|nr:hypothetical protein [Methanomicrobiales archaeon]
MAGSHIIAGSILVLLLFITASGAQVTRGNTFTVTVVGSPRTAYDIWPSGTHDMTGEPGDQPPIIVAGQVGVVQDPAGGPYVIGNHPIGGGRTILGDVPPDSSTTSATVYYAEVTTDVSGYGVVLFQTSHNTATGRQFHIVAENPADPGEDVQVVLGGIPTPPPTPVMPLPLPTTMETPFMPVTVTPATGTPVPPVTILTTAPTIAPVPMETPAETIPARAVPIPPFAAIAAAATGLLWAGRRGP